MKGAMPKSPASGKYPVSSAYRPTMKSISWTGLSSILKRWLCRWPRWVIIRSRRRLRGAPFGVIVLVFGSCRQVYGATRVAWLASIEAATMPLFCVVPHRHFRPDVGVLYLRGYIRRLPSRRNGGAKRRNECFLGAAATGFAPLVKGPSGS